MTVSTLNLFPFQELPLLWWIAHFLNLLFLYESCFNFSKKEQVESAFLWLRKLARFVAMFSASSCFFFPKKNSIFSSYLMLVFIVHQSRFSPFPLLGPLDVALCCTHSTVLWSLSESSKLGYGAKKRKSSLPVFKRWSGNPINASFTHSAKMGFAPALKILLNHMINGMEFYEQQASFMIPS